MELTLLQEALVGVAASAITQALRLLANNFGWAPNEEQTVAGLFVVSVGFALAFFGIPEVTGSDPLAIAEQIAQGAVFVVGAAGLSYSLLLKKVLRSAD